MIINDSLIFSGSLKLTQTSNSQIEQTLKAQFKLLWEVSYEWDPFIKITLYGTSISKSERKQVKNLM